MASNSRCMEVAEDEPSTSTPTLTAAPSDPQNYKAKYRTLKENHHHLCMRLESALRETQRIPHLEKEIEQLKRPISKTPYEKLTRTGKTKANRRILEKIQCSFPSYHRDDFVAAFKMIFPELAVAQQLSPTATLEVMAETQTTYEKMDQWRSSLAKRGIHIFASKRQVLKVRRLQNETLVAAVPVNEKGRLEVFKLQIGHVQSDVPNAYISNLQSALQRRISVARIYFSVEKPLHVVFVVTESANLVKLSIAINIETVKQPVILVGVYEGASTYEAMAKLFKPIADCVNGLSLVNMDGTSVPVLYLLTGDIRCLEAVTQDDCFMCTIHPNMFNLDRLRVIPPCRDAINKAIVQTVAFIVTRLFQTEHAGMSLTLPKVDSLTKYEGLEAKITQKASDLNAWGLILTRLQLHSVNGSDNHSMADPEESYDDMTAEDNDSQRSTENEKSSYFKGRCSLSNCIAKVTEIDIPHRSTVPDWMYCGTQEHHSKKWYHTVCLGLSEKAAVIGKENPRFLAVVGSRDDVISVVMDEKRDALKALSTLTQKLNIAEIEIAEAQSISISELVKSFLRILSDIGITSPMPYRKLSDMESRKLLQNLEDIENKFRMLGPTGGRVVDHVHAFRLAVKTLRVLRSIQSHFDDANLSDFEVEDLQYQLRMLDSLSNNESSDLFSDISFHIILHHVLDFVKIWLTVNFFHDDHLMGLMSSFDQRYASIVTADPNDRLRILLSRAYDNDFGSES